MKNIGIVVLVVGALALLYGGITCNRDHTVMDMGSMHVTATEHQDIPISAIAGLVMLAGGVVLLVRGQAAGIGRNEDQRGREASRGGEQ